MPADCFLVWEWLWWFWIGVGPFCWQEEKGGTGQWPGSLHRESVPWLAFDPRDREMSRQVFPSEEGSHCSQSPWWLDGKLAGQVLQTESGGRGHKVSKAIEEGSPDYGPLVQTVVPGWGPWWQMIKFAKKPVLAVGQLQLALNHERRMLSYRDLCRDHKRAKEHLKEASSSFGKVAKRAEKPALFGDKFKRAVIDRGTLTKQLHKAKAQFEQKPKGQFQPKAPQARSGPPTYALPLQRVQNLVSQQSYQSQPSQRDPSKKSSGRGRGSRYVSTSSQGSGSGVHGSNNRRTLCSGGRVKKRTNKRVKFTNTAGGIPVHGLSSRLSASWVAGLSGSRPGRGRVSWFVHGRKLCKIPGF